jgi:hypothetical protein
VTDSVTSEHGSTICNNVYVKVPMQQWKSLHLAFNNLTRLILVGSSCDVSKRKGQLYGHGQNLDYRMHVSSVVADTVRTFFYHNTRDVSSRVSRVSCALTSVGVKGAMALLGRSSFSHSGNLRPERLVVVKQVNYRSFAPCLFGFEQLVVGQKAAASSEPASSCCRPLRCVCSKRIPIRQD